MESYYFLFGLIREKSNGGNSCPLQPQPIIPKDSLEQKTVHWNDKMWAPSNHEEFIYPIIKQDLPSLNYPNYMRM